MVLELVLPQWRGILESSPKRGIDTVAREVSFSGARFSKAAETFRSRKTISKSWTLRYTELFYAHFLNINRGSLYTKSLRRIHFSVLYEELNIALRARISGNFEKRVACRRRSRFLITLEDTTSLLKWSNCWLIKTRKDSSEVFVELWSTPEQIYS